MHNSGILLFDNNYYDDYCSSSCSCCSSGSSIYYCRCVPWDIIAPLLLLCFLIEDRKKEGGIVSNRKNKGLDCSALHLLCLVLETLN